MAFNNLITIKLKLIKHNNYTIIFNLNQVKLIITNMGIKLLNKLLKRYALRAVNIVSLNELKNRSIVIDISIYLYKYKSQDMLLTNIYKLCSIFKHYNIDAIFVFDGEPDKIKLQTIRDRNEQRYVAKKKYYDIIDNSTDKYIKTNKNQLIELKKSFTKIKKTDIENVKKLLVSYGMKYYIAPKEADAVCGELVNTLYKDGCMSDDMDMFVYNSKYVYRNLDLVNETCLQYNLDLILKYLGMGFEDFKWMCILSSNDYNHSSKTVFDYYKLYKQYKQSASTHRASSFIEYVKYSEFMTKATISELNAIHDLYTINLNDTFNETDIISSQNDNNTLHEILEQDNFIYPPAVESY